MDSSPQYGRSARVGLAYDERMCLHATPDGESHPENPERIRAIWRKLEAEGILERCILLKIKEAEDAIIASVHTRNHINLIKNISTKEFDFRRVRIASKFNSIYFNEGSSEAAYLAAGAVIEATENVAKGNLDSAIAIVRPPGHHAEANEAMGFCLFNNVAIAASYLLNTRVELGIRRILIVDWDVHHGNGTQNMFYSDPRVLYFSVHRFDFGSFYLADGNGSHCMIGEDLGAGYNINVPWEHGQCGDADYLTVWDHILIPVVEAYNPDIILISAGFDAGKIKLLEAIRDYCLCTCAQGPHKLLPHSNTLVSHLNPKIDGFHLSLEGVAANEDANIELLGKASKNLKSSVQFNLKTSNH